MERLAGTIHKDRAWVSAGTDGMSDNCSEPAGVGRSHVASNHIADLAALFDPAVELVTVTRPASPGFATLAERLFARRVDFRTQWIQSAAGGDGARRHLAVLGAAAADAAPVDGIVGTIDEIVDTIDEAVAALACLLDCREVGVRLATLRRPMCPKFHVDRIPCRLLMTLAGPGTEWIPSDRVDRAMLADREETRPPLKPACDYEVLEPNAWSLMKGGDWEDGFPGVVHRSPLRPGSRLLLTLDPVFGPG